MNQKRVQMINSVSVPLGDGSSLLYTAGSFYNLDAETADSLIAAGDAVDPDQEVEG
jgi:hypothetical protein